MRNLDRSTQSAQRWLSLTAKARQLNTGPRTLLGRIRRREIPARLVGGSRWFLVST
jgi:hypothetical protein